MRPVAVVGLGVALPPGPGQPFAEAVDDPALRRASRMMSRSAWLAAVAVGRALEGQAVDPARTAAFLGVGPSSGAVDDIGRVLRASLEDGRLDLPRFARRGVAACNPLLTFQLMNNFTLCHAAIQHGLQGPNGAFFGGAGEAIREAILALEEVPWALAGAADTGLHPLSGRERPGGAGEAAVVLLLAREAEAPLAWVAPWEGDDEVGEEEIQARFGDCGAAGPALRWWWALERLRESEHVQICAGGMRFWRGEGVVLADSSPRAPGGGASEAGGGGIAPPRGEVELDRQEEQPPLRRLRRHPPASFAGVRKLTPPLGGEEVAVQFASSEQQPSNLPQDSSPRAAGGGASEAGGGGLAPPPPLRSSRPRPVITAAHAITPFGAGLDALWDGLLSGATALAPPAHLPGFPDSGAVPAGPELLDQLPPDLRDSWRAEGWLRDRRLWWAVAAAEAVWQRAGRPPNLALSLGLGLEQALLDDWLPLVTDDGLDWSRAAPSPPLRFRAPFDLPARAVAELVGAGPRRLVHASACAAGTLAVAQAAAWVARGEVDAVLCGGADSMLNPLGLAGLGRLGVISPRGVCRPFDRRRDGILVGEGAAIFLVEREDRARARGARPLAAILGWGSSQDGHAPTAPRPGGEPARVAMAAALRRAGLPPEAIGYLNAHGTGTPPNDAAEAAAIRALFPVPPPTGSFKGAFGHAMAAAGALELAGCLVAFARGQIPGTAGYERPDEALGLPIVANAQPWDGRALLSNSFGFGGQNASLILGHPDD